MGKKESLGIQAIKKAKERAARQGQHDSDPPTDAPAPSWVNPLKKAQILKEAFKRNQIYRNEFEAAFKSFLASNSENISTYSHDYIIDGLQSSEEGQALCKRWGLSFALHPDSKLWDLSPGWPIVMFLKQCRAIEMLPYGEAKVIQIPTMMIPYSKAKPFRSPPTKEALKNLISKAKRSLNLIKKTVDRRPWLREGRYLRIEVDLSQSRRQIEAEIKDLVEKYRPLVSWSFNPPQVVWEKKPLPQLPDDLPDEEWFRRRQYQEYQKRKTWENQSKKIRRGPSLDIYLDEQPDTAPITIFQVWDMSKKDGKSLWKIAQELYPYLKSLTPQRCEYLTCEWRETFEALPQEEKELFSKQNCGKKDSCLEAQARLKNVKDAIERADMHISSIEPIR